MLIPSYDYRSGEDPPVVREAKWLLDRAAYVLLGWWLAYLKYRFPRTQGVVNSVPNAMSVLRIPASPVVAYLLAAAIWQGNTNTAWKWFGCSVGLIVLDGLDGPLARQLNAVSDFGKGIDPAADKVLIFSLAVTYSVLVFEFQGVFVFIPVAAMLIWSFWVEWKLIRVAAETKLLVESMPDEELPGANVFGKIKFSIQSLSFILAFILMIVSPSSVAGGLWLAGCMTCARWFADKSYGRHRQDVWKLEAEARRRRLPALPKLSAKDVISSLINSSPSEKAA